MFNGELSEGFVHDIYVIGECRFSRAVLFTSTHHTATPHVSKHRHKPSHALAHAYLFILEPFFPTHYRLTRLPPSHPPAHPLSIMSTSDNHHESSA